MSAHMKNHPKFPNVDDNEARADAYSKLEFPRTYYLDYRDLPAVRGMGSVLGCGVES